MPYKRVPPGPLSAAEQEELCLKWRFLPLSIYNRMLPMYRERLDEEDALQEGYLGLRAAAKRFDPARGRQFSTYASYWVRQAIQRAALSQGGTIKVPCWAVGAGGGRNSNRARQRARQNAGFALHAFPLPVNDYDEVILPGHELAPDAIMEMRESVKELRRAFARLTLWQQRVLIERYWHGRSDRTIADAVGLTRSSVTWARLAAVQRLREELRVPAQLV